MRCEKHKSDHCEPLKKEVDIQNYFKRISLYKSLLKTIREIKWFEKKESLPRLNDYTELLKEKVLFLSELRK